MQSNFSTKAALTIDESHYGRYGHNMTPGFFHGCNISFLKVPIKEKIIAAYFKGLSKYRRMVFFFLEYLFLFYRYLCFLE